MTINLLRALKTIKKMSKRLEGAKPYCDPSLVAFMIRDDPDIIAAELDDLCWGLGRDHGCHRNDVRGVLELLEKMAFEDPEPVLFRREFDFYEELHTEFREDTFSDYLVMATWDLLAEEIDGQERYRRIDELAGDYWLTKIELDGANIVVTIYREEDDD